jgi:hypothetical protein
VKLFTQTGFVLASIILINAGGRNVKPALILINITFEADGCVARLGK